MIKNKPTATTFVQPIYWLSCWLVILYSPNIIATQLIDQLPATLEDSWQHCHLFESKPMSCQPRTLPLTHNHSESQPKYQEFTKNIIINSSLKNTLLGLFIANVDDVDEVYLNEKLIGKTGRFLPDFESGFRYQRLYQIPSNIIRYNQFNQIKIKTFSSQNLPSIQIAAPLIDNYLLAQHKIQEHDYIFIITTTILLLLTIFQVFYFLVVKDNYETIYCTFYLVGFAIISIVRSQMPLDYGLDLSSAFKLESIMLTFGMMALNLFILKFFELQIRLYHTIGLFILGSAGLVTIIWPSPVDLRYIAEFSYWSIIIIGILLTGHALVIAARKKRKYIRIMLITLLTLWLVLVYDAITQSSSWLSLKFPMQQALISVCSAIIGLVLTLTITHKYWQFFKGATYDHLTGTLLRPAFFQRVSEEMQRSQRSNNQLLIAVIDIQQAKKISLNYGYNIGNHLLSTVSNSLTKVLRPFDLICKFNDEQFCIAASVQNKEDAESCLKRVYQELIGIKHPIENEVELYIDTRIGGIIFNQELHLTVSHLLQDASYALSKAKSQSHHNYLLIQNAETNKQ